MTAVNDDDLEASVDLTAAEFVLGTLSADERAEFRREIVRMPAAARAAADWELRLRPVLEAVPERQAPEAIWTKISRTIDMLEAADDDRTDVATTLLFSPDQTRIDPVMDAQSGPSLKAADEQIVALKARQSELLAKQDALESDIRVARRRAGRARVGAWMGGALAAGLAGFILVQQLDLLPTAQPPERYIAVVSADGSDPAMLVWVDIASEQIFVKPVATEAPNRDQDLELWVIEAGIPRSLGLVEASATVVGRSLGANTLANDAQIAITLEPAGGAPEGLPTGPVVYSGQLVADLTSD